MQQDEKIIFSRDNIQVTRSKLIIGSSVYAIRNIARAKGLEKYPGCLGQIIGKKSTYMIMLSTSSGEINAFESEDKEIIGDLLKAVEIAIAQH